MESDKNYKEDYVAFMKKMIDQGHVEKVTSTALSLWGKPE